MLEFLQSMITILNELSTGKFIVFVLVAIPLILIFLVVMAIIFVVSAFITGILVYEWLESRWNSIRNWWLRRCTDDAIRGIERR